MTSIPLHSELKEFAMVTGATTRSCNAADAAKKLTDLIASTPYVLHSRLPPERELADSLQLPRGRLREALQLLEDDGRIWRAVGMGTFIGSRPQSVNSSTEALGAATTLAELLEARRLLEPIVAGLASLRAEQADIERMEQYSTAANQSQSWAEWEKWDDLVHRAIVEASGNGLLINMMDQLMRIKAHPRWTMRRATNFDPMLTSRYSREHAAVVACIVSHDSEGASAAMLSHISGISATVGPAISNRPSMGK